MNKNVLTTLVAGAMLMSVGCGQSTPTTPTTPATTSVSSPAPASPGVTVTAPSATVNVGGGGDVVVTAPSATVAVTTGGGTPDSDKTMGVPPYPGASQQMSAQGTTGNDAGAVSIMTTTDPYDKVVAFYKEKFPSAKVTSMDAAGMKNTAIVVEADQGKTLAITITSQGPNTLIQVAQATHTGGSGDDDNDAPSTDDTMAPGSSPAPDDDASPGTH